MKRQHPHNKKLTGWRGSMPAVEITPLGAALAEAGRAKGEHVMRGFKLGYCPVSKLFPHSDIIRDFYNP